MENLGKLADLEQKSEEIAKDIEEVQNNCQKINCRPVKDTLMSLIKLITDLLLCFWKVKRP